MRRYSFRIIFIRSSHSFQASLDTLSKMRWPSSPGQGTVSKPGSSFWNFTHITFRPLVLVDAAAVSGCPEGPQESAMVAIVMHLAHREHRPLRIDGENEARMRRAQCGIDLNGMRPARENEPQVAGPLWKRNKPLVRLGGDLNLFDAGNAACLLHTIDSAEDAALRDGNHHDA